MRFGDVLAVDRVSLELTPGVIVGLVGPNGAGKTTLISMLAGLLSPAAGTVDVYQHGRWRSPGQARGTVGVATQDIALYLSQSVERNLALFASLQGVPRREQAAEIRRVADSLALDPLLARRCESLSGGERRLVHIAAAILGSPPAVMLDEPTAGADVHARDTILAAVRCLAREGAAVLCSTHYLEEAEAICDHIIVLDRGSVVDSGPIEAFVAKSRTWVALTWSGGVVLNVGVAGAVSDLSTKTVT
ncbi:MAG: ABC transporter ATP-binding protein, partial [Acidimicrobiales bacterium]